MRRTLSAAAAGVAALALWAPPASAGKPKIEMLVVGRTGVLQEPVKFRVVAVNVRIKGRKCKLADGTPLGALELLRRRGGPSFGLKDFGACSRRAADAGGLFVTKIGPDRNRDQDGWVYKVGRKVGSAGAGDAAGPFGTGRRLQSRQRLTWFWCVTQSEGGCQRTLEVTLRNTSVAPGASLRVGVRGYDDQGRPKRVAGATVLLGSATATTDANGRATVTAPSTPGRYKVIAEGAGMVRSFPVAVEVA
jgi:hypothetical protein